MGTPFTPLPLLCGLALGATAAFVFRHLSASPPASSASTASPLLVSGSSLPPGSLLLLPRLAGTEADTALDAWLALPPLAPDAPAAEITARLTRLRALLTLLPTAHFERLFAALAPRTGSAEARLRRAAFDVWIERDAPAAARWALAIVPGQAIDANARGRYLSLAVLAWAETAFDPAYAWASALGDVAQSRSLVGQLLAQLIATDPTRALAVAHERGPEFFDANRLLLLEAWAKTDPGAALNTFGVDLKRTDYQQWSVQHALHQWLARDPRAAFDWMLARSSENESIDQRLLEWFTSVAGGEPTAPRPLLELISARPDLPGQLGLLHTLVYRWVQNDPRAALAWLDTLPDIAQRNELIEARLFALKLDDYLAFVRLLPESPAREKQIDEYVAFRAERAPDAVLAWLEASDAPELAASLSRVQDGLLARLAGTDPAAALARWETLPSAAERQAALGPITRAWSQSDPVGAAAWLTPHLEAPGLTPEQRNELLPTYRSVAGRLARTDPEAVLRLAETATDPELRLNAYQALANDHHEEPNGAMIRNPVSHASRAALLATIPDSRAREQSLTAALSAWLQRDHDTARAWLDTHDALSPEAAARLIENTAPLSLPNL